MSSDNYIHVRKDGDDYEVFHGFASDEDLPDRPIFVSRERDEALRFAHTFARDNWVVYGVAVGEEVWA